MKPRFLAFIVPLVLAASVSFAQGPPRRQLGQTGADRPTISPGEMTPEMWFYEQQVRLYEDPKHAVRRKAEFRAAQRQRRIESRKWFGHSVMRPTYSPVPYTSYLSPTWVGNGSHPFHWTGSAPIWMPAVPVVIGAR